MSFSSYHRNQTLAEISKLHFDLLIIGGGITGAGIALDASSRCIQTCLVEMQDFAGGTSSRSTKLIHGGLRYLKQLEFGLVAEVGKERSIVYKNAPHLTIPEPMLLPLIKGGSINKIAAFFGMWLYDVLAGVKRRESRKMLSKEATLKKEPLLRKDILTGGVHYFEYRTDDARLTIEVLKEAAERGAKAVNYVKATGFLYKAEKICGIKAEDVITGNAFEIYAEEIVNAGGPWADKIENLDPLSQEDRLHLTKGVHLVFDGEKFPINQPMYFDAQDNRMIFAIPREGKTYAGTTDTFYSEDIQSPAITQDDRAYILGAVNHMFPSLQLKNTDVISGWAGLRPLIKQKGKSPSAISRKDEIFYAPSGLITIAGGKLTAYRKMAERVTNIVAKILSKKLHKSYPSCHTANIAVSGGKIDTDFNLFLKKSIEEGINRGLTEKEARSLVMRFGSNTSNVFTKVSSKEAEAKTYNLPIYLYAQLLYCMEEEMTVSPTDFFIRRTGALYFNPEIVRTFKKAIIECMGAHLKWDQGIIERFSKELDEEISIATISY